jgi:peptidylprolyl isomerase
MKYIKLLLLGLMTAIFIACGGGSSSSDDDNGTQSSSALASNEVPTPTPTPTPTPLKVNQKPIANAGVDQNVTFGHQVILDASGSTDDGTIVKYEWINRGKVFTTKSSIILENFPQEGTYTIDLNVTDDKGEVSTDSIKILTYSDTIVLLKTTQGDIELKMKSDIAPKAVENFVTHSKNGYYDGLTFHRIIKDFMIQGGDPKGNGTGGESIWGEPFEDEFDSSVTFDRPFLLAMANSGPTTNGSQFFITVVPTTWLNNKHTIFGEVMEGNETVTKLENVETSRSGKPFKTQTIIKASVKFEVPQ